jgi:NAD(P)-dependent dehydrogenase (short-subunit alcohol dehydrogenase family)
MDETYLVVGGTSGIGKAVVSALLDRGARVWEASRSEKGLGGDARHIRYDAASGEFPSDTLPNRLSGLVYCPGTIRLRPFQRLTDDDFREDLEINLIGAVRTIRACLPALKKSPEPSGIVLFSSVAVGTGMAFHSSVAGAKGAVEGLTRSLAAELAPAVRVNAVAPSLTDTPLAGSLLANDEKRRAAVGRHPLRRLSAPEEVARTVLFLLTEAPGVTGQVLPVDGGISSVRLFG